MSSWWIVNGGAVKELVFYGFFFMVGMLIPISIIACVLQAYKWVKRAYK